MESGHGTCNRNYPIRTPGALRNTHVLESHGWEARIFQHEIDHLDGVLYVDRLVGPLLPIEEMRRRREEEKAACPSSLSIR